MLTIGAIFIGRPEIAVGVIFASSVAALTLVLGIVTIAARHTHPTSARRLWAFVLPVALISLLIGFSGGFRWMHVPLLLLEGLALLLVWNDPPLARVAWDASAHEKDPQTSKGGAPSSGARVGLILFALIAGGVSAWAGLIAAVDLSNRLELPGAGLVSALMLSPALVLAMIGNGSQLSGAGHYDEAASSQVGFVLLNLCLLLPLATVLWLTRPQWHPPLHALFAPTTQPTTDPATTRAIESLSSDAPRTLSYPMAVWRVDTVMLIALGLLLLPMALGRWSIGMSEGFGLIVSYTIYMVLTAWLAR
jgi:hypothetical protein